MVHYYYLGGVQRPTTIAILVVFRANLGHMVVNGRKWSFFKVKFKATFFHKDDLEGVNIDSMDSNIAAVGASAAP